MSGTRGADRGRLGRHARFPNGRVYGGANVFPNYRIVNQLDAGRDGVSYRALDIRNGNEVILVALDAQLEAPALKRRVARRLRLASLLTHPTAWRIHEL